MLVYDTTNEESIHNLGYWVQEIKRYAPTNCPILMVGTKIDLASQRRVTADQVLAFSQQYCGGDANLIETSSKTGKGVEKAFEELARRVYKARNILPDKPDTVISDKPSLLLNDDSSSTYSTCSC